jgi:hypothetical protein
MNNNSQQLSSISLDQLSNVCGGGDAPLSGDVTQDINTNWGGSQTNTHIDTQIINPAPPKPSSSIVDYLRNNPAARLEAQRRRPVRYGY